MPESGISLSKTYGMINHYDISMPVAPLWGTADAVVLRNRMALHAVEEVCLQLSSKGVPCGSLTKSID